MRRFGYGAWVAILLASTGYAGSAGGSPTSTEVAASAAAITLGDNITLTAVVSTAAGFPSGLVVFFDGSAPLAAVKLTGIINDLTVTYPTSVLSAGTHTITAVYGGDATHRGSRSIDSGNPIQKRAIVSVNPRMTTAGVVVNPTNVVVGQSSTATATVTDSGTVPPGTAATFTPTGAPVIRRDGATATLFTDGLVLVTGGAPLGNAEVYSASNGTFSPTGLPNATRIGGVAVLLPNGQVLIAGGSSDGTPSGAVPLVELYNPATGQFTMIPSDARLGATATLLPNGKVLLAGGENSIGILNSAELYDPATSTFTATGNLNLARTGHSATLLQNGTVLIVGGSGSGAADGALNNAELFDPAGNSGAGTFTLITGPNSSLSAGRWQPETALLSNGNVLVAGGQNSAGALASADLYDPMANTFAPSSHSMAQARANGSALPLPNGMILLAGGTTSQVVELYDPLADRFYPTGSLQQSDNGLLPVLLNNGDVLVIGVTTGPSAVSDAELYAPSFDPLGVVTVSSSEATDNIAGTCGLAPISSTASTCTATVTPANVATSPHTITGSYATSPDGVHAGASNTASLTVNKSDTVTNITTHTPNPSGVNTAVTVGATVAATAPGSGTPTGTVTISDGVETCTITLNSGAGSCSITPATPGPKNLTATYNGDTNFNISSSGNVSQTVIALPSTIKFFSPASISVDGTSTMTISITNPAGNPVGLQGVAFTDNFPANLVVATPNGLSNTCGGTATAVAGSASVSLTSGMISINGSCTVTVNVTAIGSGILVNNTGPISFSGGAGDSATATLMVGTGAITVDSQGHVLVALFGSNKVLVFDNRNGSLVADAAHPTLNPGLYGAFNGPQGIAVDSKDNIFVSDGGHNRIVVFSSIAAGAAAQTQITTAGNIPLNQPGSLAVDSSDHLLALDMGNNRIAALTINHAANNTVSSLLTAGQIGPSVGILGQLNVPLDVAVDSQDHILVADSGNHRIAVFRSIAQGSSPLSQIGPGIGVFGQLANPTGVAANLKDPTSSNKDEVIIADSSPNNPRVIILASVAQGNTARSQILSSPQNGQLSGMQGGLRTDLNGNILLLEPTSSRLAEFSDTGVFRLSIPIPF
ncbi:MAG TPA: kelch repeat-containing protein [Bryobacteraceae bacterium]|nr:kelch repeat-containing protein [Bryobacteraceae bacterium]